jgi:hypothetical protein
MYAGFARVADDRAALRQQVLDGLALMMTIIVPLSIGIALMASSITRLGLGQSWSETIPLIRLCAFYALFDAIGHFTHNVYTVLHRQRRFVGVFTVALAVRLPSVVMAAIWYGVTGAAAAMADRLPRYSPRRLALSSRRRRDGSLGLGPARPLAGSGRHPAGPDARHDDQPVRRHRAYRRATSRLAHGRKPARCRGAIPGHRPGDARTLHRALVAARADGGLTGGS